MGSNVVRLAEVAAVLHVPYNRVLLAAQAGRIPAWQPLGKHSTWYVPANFLAKADAVHQISDEVKHG